jgi:microcystin-dependent protein
MPKTTIACDFRNSIGAPLSGYILVGVDSWLMKDTEAQSITNLTGRVEFVNGACNLLLETSDADYVTYSFEVYYYDAVTTSDPDTGEPVITTSDFPLIPKFYARVPASLTPISFNQLAKQSGINRDNLDTAISALVRRLYNEDTFWARLQQNLFVSRGAYDPLAWYSRGDVVNWGGGSYLYYYPDRSQGTLPNITTHWQQIASKGDIGAGTTGNNSPLDAGWDGQLDAPSRNAVYDALQQYALASTVAGLAPLTSPNFLGTPTRATSPTQSDSSSQIPTTAWVQNLITTVSKALIPVGTIVTTALLSAPTGWVFCDGRVLSQTTYATLFAALGTTYNTGGEAAGTFRIPDLRGRFMLTPDGMGGVNANRAPGVLLASGGGAATVTLDSTQIPSHRHNISVHGFNVTGIGESFGSGYGAIAHTNIAPTGGLTNIAGNRTASADGLGAIANTGGGLPHPNLPPYLGLNSIIYTGV